MLLTSDELFDITGGGFSLTSTALNAIVGAAKVALEIGRAIGTAISMAFSGKKC